MPPEWDRLALLQVHQLPHDVLQGPLEGGGGGPGHAKGPEVNHGDLAAVAPDFGVAGKVSYCYVDLQF